MKEISVLYIYIENNNGYGISARALINAMEKVKGIDLDLLPINKPNIQNEKKLKDHYDVAIIHVSTSGIIHDIQSRGYLSLCLSRCVKKYQYFLWETDRLPSAWEKFFKEDNLITGFICPSHFCEDLVKSLRPESTHYIPINIGDNIEYHPDKRKADPDKFTVLTVAQLSVRKAIDMSVCAFASAFVGQDDVQYYIKIGEKLDGIEPDQLIRGNVARSMISNPPPIFVIDDMMTEDKMKELYFTSNCMLHLSRGEGFGMTPLTAINYGLPVIYSDWSAHKEFLCKDKNSIAVDGRLDLVHSSDPRFGFESGMLWYEINVASAVAALRTVYEKWKSKKLKYNVPSVAKEYRQEAIYEEIGKLFGLEKVEIKEDKKIDGISVVEL